MTHPKHYFRPFSTTPLQQRAPVELHAVAPIEIDWQGGGAVGEPIWEDPVTGETAFVGGDPPKQEQAPPTKKGSKVPWIVGGIGVLGVAWWALTRD
jgi:hypothetical protein